MEFHRHLSRHQNNGEGESASLYKLLSEDKDPCSVNQEKESVDKVDEVDANASQVTFDTMGTFDSVEGRGRGRPAAASWGGDQLLFALRSCGHSVGGSVFGVVRSFNREVVWCSVISHLVFGVIGS